MGHLIGVFPGSFLITHLFEGTMDESVLGVHDGSLTVFFCLSLDQCCCAITHFHNLLMLRHAFHHAFYIFVTL